MKISKKLGCSIALLSVLALFAGWYNFSIVAVLFVLILAFADEAELRNNVSVAFFLSFFKTIIIMVLGWLGERYSDFLNFIENTILKNVPRTDVFINIFKFLYKGSLAPILVNIIKFAFFVITIVFIILVMNKKTLKFPGISKLVEKTVAMEQDDVK